MTKVYKLHIIVLPLSIILLCCKTLFAQDEVYLFSGESIKCSILKLGVDSIHYKNTKKGKPIKLLSNLEVKYIVFESGKQHYILHDNITLEAEIIIAHIDSITDDYVYFKDLPLPSYHKSKRVAIGKVMEIQFKNGDVVTYHDRIYKEGKETIFCQVIKVQEDFIAYIPINKEKTEKIPVKNVSWIKFKNGFVQKFNNLNDTSANNN